MPETTSEVSMQQPPDLKGALEGLARVASMEVELASHHYIVLSFLYPWMATTALASAHGVMLDYGCGGQPYRTMFETKVSRYIGADVAAAANTKIDLEFQPGRPLPLGSSTIDTIL